MPYEDRKQKIKKIEELRRGRRLVCFFNFDRISKPPVSGLETLFAADVKEALFRVLKETLNEGSGAADLCLYTRGGDTNAVWPIVSLIREFDSDFEVLAPFRCHSSGTLLALGAKRIVLGPLSELSPIDPSTGNQFNPVDPVNPKNRLAISVEDVQSYRNFIAKQMKRNEEDLSVGAIAPFVDRLVNVVHPLALGNVDRVNEQIKQLARNLLALHPIEGRDEGKVVTKFTTEFYSHLHMISRHEALAILGDDQVEMADSDLAAALDDLLRAYEDDFHLRRPFILPAFIVDDLEKDVRFIGGAVESFQWSYLFETRAKVRQFSKLPANVQVQVPVGQPMPLIPGLPREYQIDVLSEAWIHNKEPQGITV